MEMKDAFYFPHDSNASQDPKILQMCSVYGAQGYGWYWMLIEIMRDQEGYKLDISGKYACNSLAIRMYTDKDTLVSFLYDCVSEFKLFKRDDNYIWSDSLIRRMQTKDIKSQKARESVMHRWNKKSETARPDTNVSETYYDENTDVSKNDTKEEKRREKKRKEDNPKEKDARACATDGQAVDNLSPGEGNPSSEVEGHGEPDGGSDGELSADENQDFMTFWNTYPKKVDISLAMQEWTTLIEQGVRPADLVLSAKKYIAYLKKHGEEQFTKKPHKFLGEGTYVEYLPKHPPDCPYCGGSGWKQVEEPDGYRGWNAKTVPCDCRIGGA